MQKAIESLQGLCAGLVADGQLNDDEIKFLHLWLKNNESIANIFPADILNRRLQEVLADGRITEDERTHLHETLADLIGGTLQETGTTGGGSTRLPVSDHGHVEISGCRFCLTGKFLLGPRKYCEDVIQVRGGNVADSVTTDLSYLVIGSLASEDWVHTSYGRKIEKAVEYQNKGHAIRIISERYLTSFLG